jgi:ABC-type Zn2+ transport system substrate-binding protein/surface adhesin
LFARIKKGENMLKIGFTILSLLFFIGCSEDKFDDTQTKDKEVKRVDWDTLGFIKKSSSTPHRQNNQDELTDDENEDEGLEENNNHDDEVAEKNDDENNQNENDWGSYEQELKKEMAKAISTYPKPPVPANLTPYDDVDENNLRKPTQTETSKGTDDFPPVPPAMYLLK